MKIERSFAGSIDRYQFDFSLCSYARGWAQFDTAQDASWFGNWVNPTARKLLSYAEGDICLITCSTDEEFAAEVRRKAKWHEENDGRSAKIDSGLSEELTAVFVRLGLSDLLH